MLLKGTTTWKPTGPLRCFHHLHNHYLPSSDDWANSLKIIRWTRFVSFHLCLLFSNLFFFPPFQHNFLEPSRATIKPVIHWTIQTASAHTAPYLFIRGNLCFRCFLNGCKTDSQGCHKDKRCASCIYSSYMSCIVTVCQSIPCNIPFLLKDTFFYSRDNFSYHSFVFTRFCGLILPPIGLVIFFQCYSFPFFSTHFTAQ